VAVLPGRSQPEEADSLDLGQGDLIVPELGGRRQPSGQAGLAGALGAGAVPAQQLEVVVGLVLIRPLDDQQAPGAVGEDVDRPLAVL